MHSTAAVKRMDYRFTEGDLDSADVRALLADHSAAMRSQSPPESCHVLDRDELRSPDIRFWSLREGDGELLGIGALKLIEPGHGEIKSMRTAPGRTRRGVGGAMLRHIIDTARRAGFTRISLETGTTPYFDPAMRLYHSFGFRDCPPFADYREDQFSHYMTLDLTAAR